MSWRVLFTDLLGEVEAPPMRNRAERQREVERVDRLARERFRAAIDAGRGGR